MREPPFKFPSSHSKINFLLDNMLKGLTRWLRFLGFFAYTEQDLSKIAKMSIDLPKFIFLTTSQKNFNESSLEQKYLIESNQISEQLSELNDRFGIYSGIELLSICSICNYPVNKVNKEKIKKLVPPKTFQNFDDFWQCPKCQRIYWKGTHTIRLMEKLIRMGVPVQNK